MNAGALGLAGVVISMVKAFGAREITTVYLMRLLKALFKSI